MKGDLKEQLIVDDNYDVFRVFQLMYFLKLYNKQRQVFCQFCNYFFFKLKNVMYLCNKYGKVIVLKYFRFTW